MPGEGGARPSGSYRTNFIARFNAHQFLYPLSATVLLTVILTIWERRAADGPDRLLEIFQTLSVVFFVALLFRLLLRPSQKSPDEESLRLETGAAGNAELWLAFGVGILAYIRTLPLSLLCDDFAHLESVRRPFSVAIWPQFTKGQDGTFYRPLAFVSLFLDYRLWHQWIPGYHLTNLLLHLLCIAGVFQICKELELKKQLCFAGTLFFALLPVNVQTVTWSAARFDQLGAVFGIWSIVCAAKFRRTRAYGACWGANALFVLGVLCKENIYILPVLWLALEMVPHVKGESPVSFGSRAVNWAGYLVAPGLMMLLRLHLLSGVGGYRTGSAPTALHFPFASVFGLIVRAPGETLFGYDWLQPGSRLWVFSAALTAAVFLMLAFRMKTDARSRRLILFALIWIFLSAAPAHFYFWGPDPGLFVSRTLYFGSIGVAILIAVLLDQAITAHRLFYGWAVSIGLLLFAGTQHNISAWQSADHESQKWLAALKQEHPSPPANAVYYVEGAPRQYRGVPFFAAGLESAVRFNYSWRGDIRVFTEASPEVPSDAILVKYDWPKE